MVGLSTSRLLCIHGLWVEGDVQHLFVQVGVCRWVCLCVQFEHQQVVVHEIQEGCAVLRVRRSIIHRPYPHNRIPAPHSCTRCTAVVLPTRASWSTCTVGGWGLRALWSGI